MRTCHVAMSTRVMWVWMMWMRMWMRMWMQIRMRMRRYAHTCACVCERAHAHAHVHVHTSVHPGSIHRMREGEHTAAVHLLASCSIPAEADLQFDSS